MSNDRHDLHAVAPNLRAEGKQRELILEHHRQAIEAGHQGYMDPLSGLFVMTAQYLLDQGRCCDSRCRHCPYDS